MQVRDMTPLPDPCPMPGKKRKGLNDKERLVYAPMADVGGLLFDKDAVYIDIPDWKVRGCWSGVLEELCCRLTSKQSSCISAAARRHRLLAC